MSISIKSWYKLRQIRPKKRAEIWEINGTEYIIRRTKQGKFYGDIQSFFYTGIAPDNPKLYESKEALLLALKAHHIDYEHEKLKIKESAHDVR